VFYCIVIVMVIVFVLYCWWCLLLIGMLFVVVTCVVLLICNSKFISEDPVLIMCSIDKTLSPIAKDTLFNMPVLRFVLKHINGML
jgi:c-di-AMP phosphodiesterase-like protein